MMKKQSEKKECILMKVLVTGFDPFGGDKINPAYEAVKRLPDTILGATIVKREVPTVFGKSSQVLEALLTAEQPDVVICVGQAGGRYAVSFERVAINLVEARIPDNEGNQPMDEPVEADGDSAYFTTLPIKAMVKEVHEAGLPGYVSYTAGTYVCNYLMYSLMYLINKKFPTIKGGFIHVPFIPEQVVDRPVTTPSMELEAIVTSLEKAIEAAISNEKDIQVNVGTTH
jgi:pyroglutamyl-peptidase